jgi:hypothetical protein
MVSWKAATGRPRVSYDDAVSEALAFGWVDSIPRRLDAERTMLYFSRRNPTSAWSRPNKKRVEELRAQGLMTQAGEDVISQAQSNGSWSRLDDIEDLVEPEDLTTALDASPLGTSPLGRVPTIGSTRDPGVDHPSQTPRHPRPTHRRHIQAGGSEHPCQPVAATMTRHHLYDGHATSTGADAKGTKGPLEDGSR